MDTKQRNRSSTTARRRRTVSSDKSRVGVAAQKKNARESTARNTPEVVYTAPKPFNRNRLLLRLATVAAVAIAFLLSLSVFFKVQNVQVFGNTKYDAHSIWEASGISNGENLITLSRAKAAGRIMKALPYVKSVRIGIKLPDTVMINIEEVEVTYAVKASDDSWWLLSCDGKVIDQAQAGEQISHTKLLGVQIEVPQIGQMAVAMEPPAKTDEEGNTLPVTVTAAQQLKTALEIAQYLETNHIIGEAASIDVTSVMDMVLWYGQKFQVKLGDSTALGEKINRMKNVIDHMAVNKPYASGIIDLTDPNATGIPYTSF